VSRPAGLDDLETLFAIQKESAVAGFANVFPQELYPFPDDAIRETLREQLADAGNTVLLEDEERGFAVAGDGWLHRLYVRPSAWGAGVGAALHEDALAALREQGVASASLWCLAENDRARRFYERRGWRLNGTERTVPFPPYPLDVGYSIDLRRRRRGRVRPVRGLRYWEDFPVGDEAVHGTHEVTEAEIVRFAREFDPQPFHADPEEAAVGPFGGLIASGWHTAALYMGLFVRSQLLGSASLGSPGVEELRWLVPVRPGDVLTGRSRVVDAWPSATNPNRGTIVGEHELVNQRGEVVMRMRARGHLARRPEPDG
jgi:acyl dehydratase/GNAT superfamily N-acetyltransferase